MTITLIDIAAALWFIFPAYCANGAPVIFGGGKALDFGKNFIDGKPLFGSHKTFRGFFSGILIGTCVGFVQTILYEQVLFQYSPQFQCSILLGFMISLFSIPVSPPSLLYAIIILLVTLPTHWLTNFGASLLNMKNKRKEK